MAGGPAPILVIKRPKKGGHAPHGGMWKVAYADFVTAMMAFFLLLWLLNSATEEQLLGISDYFAPISTDSTTSGAGGILRGQTIVTQRKLRDAGSVPTSKIGPDGEREVIYQMKMDAEAVEMSPSDQKPAKAKSGDRPSDEDLDEMLAEREEKQFEETEKRLRDAIQSSPGLRALAEHLMVTHSPEGLNIQIMDREGLPMFPRGSPRMHSHTNALIKLVAEAVAQMPQDIAITGHTDATRFANDHGYTNWELSADRANAARRTLVDFGVPDARISRVVGKAANDPLIADDPEAPANRRLSVVLLRGTNRAMPTDSDRH